MRATSRRVDAATHGTAAHPRSPKTRRALYADEPAADDGLKADVSVLVEEFFYDDDDIDFMAARAVQMAWDEAQAKLQAAAATPHPAGAIAAQITEDELLALRLRNEEIAALNARLSAHNNSHAADAPPR